MTRYPLSRIPWVVCVSVAALACSDESSPVFDEPADDAADEPEIGQTSFCTIPLEDVFAGAVRDGIPALTDPRFVPASDPGADYLVDDDRVVGLELGGRAVAVPLNVLWHHEVVNLNLGSFNVAVTHCPLTGSSMAFDRGAEDPIEFGVSGLLYLNNLVMYDRNTTEAFTTNEPLWPQMARGVRCGPGSGTALGMVPSVEMTWDAWRSVYPSTLVLGSAQGFGRDYRSFSYPYGSYADLDSQELLFPLRQGMDPRRPPKERVLGIPGDSDAVAFPFGVLREEGEVAVAELRVGSHDMVVFWDAHAEAAMAYDRTIDGERLIFRVDGGAILDEGTGSTWSVTGVALSGPLESARLDPVADAYVAYWFAWSAFHPTTGIWPDLGTREPEPGR